MKDFTSQQLEMLERFKKLKIGALFSQMGTGKTRVAVELVNYNEPDFLIYVCPFSCKDNIEKELKKWHVNCDYEIIGYETLSNSDKKYIELLEKLKKTKVNFIIADESIFIKNGTTKRFNRSCKIRELCEYALILNGTPIVNNERDIYNQMQFLSTKIFNMNYYEFLHTFFVEKGYRANGKVHYVFTFYEKNRAAFTKIINPYVYMADLIFEHAVYDVNDFVDIDDSLYEQTKYDILSNYNDYSIDSIIVMFTKLATIAAESKHKNDAVINYITGKKCVCYCSRVNEVKYIKKHCDCYVIDGSTKEVERKRIIEDWEKSINKPLLLSFGVGSYSLNLQSANEIVYSSLTFNYGQYEQSRFRIKRIGQDKDIKYTYILADVGITKMMINNLYKKENLSDLIKEEINKNNLKKWLEKNL